MKEKCDVLLCREAATKRVVVRWFEFRNGKRVEVPDPHSVCDAHTLAYGVPSEVTYL